jgi:antitoxin HicB
MKHYTMLIEWSEQDQLHIVTLPEFDCKTHGQTYTEAAKNGEKVLEMILKDLTLDNQLPPTPQHYRLEVAA